MIARALAGWGRLLGLGKTPSTTEEERRLWGRLPCDTETTCRPTRHRPSADLSARVTNVSMGGACLRLPVALPLGELLSLSLPGQADTSSSEVLACVVRCDALPTGSWDIGCTFASPLTTHDLRQFNPNAAETSGADRRGWDRFPSRARATYQLVRAPALTERLPAAIVNISGGGLALQPNGPLDVGDLLSVDLALGDEYVLTALASVVRAHREEGRLVVGCNFIRELPEEQLNRLLG